MNSRFLFSSPFRSFSCVVEINNIARRSCHYWPAAIWLSVRSRQLDCANQEYHSIEAFSQNVYRKQRGPKPWTKVFSSLKLGRKTVKTSKMEPCLIRLRTRDYFHRNMISHVCTSVLSAAWTCYSSCQKHDTCHSSYLQDNSLLEPVIIPSDKFRYSFAEDLK